jgi:hypothetical protein
VAIKLEQQINIRINPIILVALLDKVTAALNNRAKIIKGNIIIIIDFIDRLIAYKNCCKLKGNRGFSNITVKIIANKIKGI